MQRLHDWSDDSGWQEFFDTYWKLIYAVAIRAGLSEAEAQDVVQETVVAVAKRMRARGYDRSKSSFKTFLYTVTRRRIFDHFRKRASMKEERSSSAAGGKPDDFGQVAEPANLALEELWETEWQNNLLDAAIERVKQKVTPKQFQIFDLSVLREMPVKEVTRLVKVNAAQVYLARHRVGSMVKKEVQRLQSGGDEGCL